MPQFTSNLSNRVVSNNLPSTSIHYASQTFIGNLPNVSLDNPTPEDEVLSFNATTGFWVNRPIRLSRCTDVNLNNLNDNDVLFYNNITNKFENKSLNISSCQDVDLDSLNNNDTLFYNSVSNKFENKGISFFNNKVEEAVNSLDLLNVNINGDSQTLNNYSSQELREFSLAMSIVF